MVAVRDWSGDRGFSLPELMVSLAILGLVLGGVFGVLRSGLIAYAWGSARVDAQQSARIALDRMARELRGAGYDPTGAGLAPVAAAAPSSVTFQKDAGSGGAVEPASVTFVLRPGESVLRRDAGAGGAQPVIDNVRRLAFTYFDRAGAPTTDASRVAAVRIELEVGAAGRVAVMETTAAIRNQGGR